MDEMRSASNQPQEQIYHVQANEKLILQLSDTMVEVLALDEGGCEIKVSAVKKASVPSWQRFIGEQNLSIQRIWKALSTRKEEGFKTILPWLLAGICLLLYLSTRLIGLKEYPIYFFSDEATQTILAEDLVLGGYSDPQGYFLPTFFYNGYQYNLGTSVYLQVIPYLLFGRVVEVNRGVSVLATSFSALFLFLMGLRVFRMKFPWLMILLLSITPVWFLHSRTSFETGLAFTFYCGFLYFYLRYRQGQIGHLYGAAVMAALAFYTYSPVRFVVLGSALLFFLVDLRYHFQNKKVIWRTLALTTLLAIPFLRFEIQYPGQNINHLRVLGSYWVQDISFMDKLGRYFTEYFLSFSPKYWFLAFADELGRHRMGPHAFIPFWMLPFILGGIFLSIRRWQDFRYRILFFSLLLAPMGGALVARGITRILVMVIPLLLFSVLFLDWLLQKLQQRFHISNLIISLAMLTVLGWANIYLLTDALKNGPTWDQDYSMSGMQYGAVQLAEKIPEFLASQPEPVHLILTPTWANGSDIVMRFFFGTPVPFDMGNIDTFINQYVPLEDDMVLVMTPEEVDRMEQSGKFTDIRIVDSIPYPTGQTGFSFVKLKYVDGIQAVFEAEAAARKVLQIEQTPVEGVPSSVAYSYLDIGTIDKIFDRDLGTLIRSMEANPMEIRITYSRPLDLEYCSARVGGTPTDWVLQLYDVDQQLIGEYKRHETETPDPRTVDLGIVPQKGVEQVRFLLKNSDNGEPAHVHLWEFTCTRQAD